ncbi:MAG: UTP--glucose-1-phosphate uridylyltransferase [Chlamydiales bacterium]|nr:UTP--glucose-1-phosphate uridylyltransferase [Chlamydiales bacterium]
MPTTSIERETTSLESECAQISPLVEGLKRAASLEEKISLLDAFPRVEEFFRLPSILRSLLSDLPKESQLVIKAVAATGQGPRVLSFPSRDPDALQKLQQLVTELIAVERFYKEIGGIVGYHLLMQRCLLAGETPAETSEVSYHPPEGVDIYVETREVREALIAGIEKISEMAEIYPVGGAADRLNFKDPKSGTPLPAAKLPFGGKTLLEGMIRDLQAREYLHYKLFGQQVQTPIVMMTSQEKDNEAQILSICESNGWFGRPKSSFHFFSQPSVPSMNTKGEWCMQGPLQLLLKPGGHGVIWKLARDSRAFEWLASLGKRKALVRQINNPIAGIDYGLLVFTGVGFKENKIFGFASCPRKAGAMEGTNVLLERKKDEGMEYVLTNIEYCDLQKCQVVDQTEKRDPEHSKFSSNTNILFIDLEAVNQAVIDCPFPGVVINPKKMSYKRDNQIIEEEVARLESTMQNIADCFVQSFPEPLPKGKRREEMRTFLTLNDRRKTISTVKREYVLGGQLGETPEGCFIDLQENARELLLDFCKLELIEIKRGLPFPFLFSYHPALGPLYTIIAQKLRRGKITSGSELKLEIAEVEILNIDLDGSLTIEAREPMGEPDSTGALIYSEKAGKCTLKNVHIHNQGIDWQARNTFWKQEVARKEECRILIHGSGEFYAENVTLKGPLSIVVEDGVRVTAMSVEGRVRFIRERISQPSWSWRYQITEDFRLSLSK